MRIVVVANTAFKVINFREGLIRILLKRGHAVCVIATGDGYEEKLEEIGCEFRDIRLARSGTSPVSEALYIKEIFSEIAKLKPDAVLSYTVKCNIYSGIVCRILALRHFPNVTGLGYSFSRQGLFNKAIILLYRLSFFKSELVFFQNENDTSVFLKHGIVKKGNIKTMPGSGVDLKKFAYVKPSDDGGHKTFILVSRMIWDKGVGLFVEAARLVKQGNPDARFVMLGPLDAESRTGISSPQIQQWVDEGVVEYLGHKYDVRPDIAKAGCVVLPSWYREGTPRSLLEAMAIGRPIITTDTPGCRDTVIDGQTGYLCPPRDRDTTVNAMFSYLALSRSSRTSMGLRARALAEEKFDESVVINAYVSVLEKQPRHSQKPPA